MKKPRPRHCNGLPFKDCTSHTRGAALSCSDRLRVDQVGARFVSVPILPVGEPAGLSMNIEEVTQDIDRTGTVPLGEWGHVDCLDSGPGLRELRYRSHPCLGDVMIDIAESLRPRDADA